MRGKKDLSNIKDRQEIKHTHIARKATSKSLKIDLKSMTTTDIKLTQQAVETREA